MREIEMVTLTASAGRGARANTGPAPSGRCAPATGHTLARPRACLEDSHSGTSPVHARPVEAPTSRFDSRGCPVHRHPRPRAEEAGRTSSTRLLQLADVEHLPRAKNEIW